MSKVAWGAARLGCGLLLLVAHSARAAEGVAADGADALTVAAPADGATAVEAPGTERSGAAASIPAPPPPTTRCAGVPGSEKAAADDAMIAGHYAAALACYQAAYAAGPKPALLYNQARALEFLGRAADSLHLLRRFEQEASPATKERVAQLPELIRSLRAQVVELDVTSPVAGAQVWVNGQEIGRTPLSETVFVPPGESTVELRAAGYAPALQAVAAVAGERRTLVLQPAPEAAVPAAAPSAEPAAADRESEPSVTSEASSGISRRTLRLAGWSALGVGAVATVLAPIAYFQGLDAVEKLCPDDPDNCRPPADAPNRSSLIAQRDTWSAVNIGSLVVAGLGLAGGAVLLWHTAEEPSAVSLALTPTGLALDGRF